MTALYVQVHGHIYTHRLLMDEDANTLFLTTVHLLGDHKQVTLLCLGFPGFETGRVMRPLTHTAVARR